MTVSIVVHGPTVEISRPDVERDRSACRNLPIVSDVSPCARGTAATGGSRPAFGQFRSPTLGPILAHAERRLADIKPGIGAMAEAIVAQQRAQGRS